MTQPKSAKPKSAPKSGRRARTRSARLRRWWVVPFALGLAGLAFYVLLIEGSLGSVAGGPPPMEQIDAQSRLKLERTIEAAERAERGSQ